MSIHSKQSRSFMTETVRAGAWHMRLLEHGFTPDFKAIPPAYTEPNNRSAMKNLRFVREKVAAWEADGHVEKLAQKATCNSPLTVADKVDSVSGKVKQRPCLDMSRHMNKFLNKHHTNFEDLSATACLYKQGDSMCVFDLENQYFHIRLSQEAKQFFGFSVPEEDGSETPYQFTVMVYGFAAAGSVVTRLIKPLQGYLHNRGIRSAIYMDDGQVVASSAEKTRQDMETTLQVFQQAGWNIQ